MYVVVNACTVMDVIIPGGRRLPSQQPANQPRKKSHPAHPLKSSYRRHPPCCTCPTTGDYLSPQPTWTCQRTATRRGDKQPHHSSVPHPTVSHIALFSSSYYLQPRCSTRRREKQGQQSQQPILDSRRHSSRASHSTASAILRPLSLLRTGEPVPDSYLRSNSS